MGRRNDENTCCFCCNIFCGTIVTASIVLLFAVFLSVNSVVELSSVTVHDSDFYSKIFIVLVQTIFIISCVMLILGVIMRNRCLILPFLIVSVVFLIVGAIYLLLSVIWLVQNTSFTMEDGLSSSSSNGKQRSAVITRYIMTALYAVFLCLVGYFVSVVLRARSNCD